MTESTPSAESIEPAVDIEILSGNPDATELAALTAVLTGVLEELAEEQGRLEQASAPSAWERSQRQVREPIFAQAGAWRSFSA